MFKKLAVIILILILSWSPFYSVAVSSQNVISVTLSPVYCTQLAKQQNTTVSTSQTSCTFSGSFNHSPMFLTNSSTALTIPSGFSLTFSANGFQFASYGNVTNQGTISIVGSVILYGIIINSGTVTISGTLGVINSSDLVGTTLFQNNVGHTVTVTGRIYNIAKITNAGTFTNSANNFFDCVSGVNYLGIFTNTGTLNGGSPKTTC